MSDAPRNIRSLSGERVLEIEWPDGRATRLPFRFLRGRCPCAACVDEISGRRIVDVQDVSEQIRPESLSLSGNYALKIAWNDRHDTGLYTWEYLRRMGEETR